MNDIPDSKIGMIKWVRSEVKCSLLDARNAVNVLCERTDYHDLTVSQLSRFMDNVKASRSPDRCHRETRELIEQIFLHNARWGTSWLLVQGYEMDEEFSCFLRKNMLNVLDGENL